LIIVGRTQDRKQEGPIPPPGTKYGGGEMGGLTLWTVKNGREGGFAVFLGWKSIGGRGGIWGRGFGVRLGFGLKWGDWFFS